MGECAFVSLASQYFGDGALWVLLSSVLDRSGLVGCHLSGLLRVAGDLPYSSTSLAIKARPLGRAAH